MPFYHNRHFRRNRNSIHRAENKHLHKYSFDPASNHSGHSGQDLESARKRIASFLLAKAMRDCEEHKKRWTETPEIAKPLHKEIALVNRELYGATVH
jgi:septation ring formation regulator EzrA